MIVKTFNIAKDKTYFKLAQKKKKKGNIFTTSVRGSKGHAAFVFKYIQGFK